MKAFSIKDSVLAQVDWEAPGPRLITWVRAEQAKGRAVIVSSLFEAPRQCGSLEQCGQPPLIVSMPAATAEGIKTMYKLPPQ